MKIFNLVVLGASFGLSANIVSQEAEVERSGIPFSSSFHQPEPPTIKSEFRANWNQHKWDANISNIASGFIYHSLSHGKVRVDEAYDSTLGSSLFDYTNVTQEGVANRQWTLSPAITSAAQCFVGFSNPGFPLVSDDFLVTNRAIYGGVMHDHFAGQVALWDILYQDSIPLTVLLDESNIIQGYDFLGPDTRARTITRFFNIIVGPVDSDVFDFPCQTPAIT